MVDSVQDIIEQAAIDIQKLIDTGYVSEDDEGLYEAFGGKKGAGKVTVPKTLTDDQILAYFDYVGTPLKTKKEKASVISAVRKQAKKPTSIGKNKSTVSSMIDALRLEIRELQKFATVQEDIIVEGGNPNANIKVPKKLTAEQTIQFMKQFPNGFPLADENAFFGIARALTLESPELFDVDSFDAYEKKFGSMMEMQEKGASASKNIVAGKELKAANEPVAAKGKSVSKLDPQTATLREVAEAYAKKSGRGKTFIGPTLQYFKDIADEPGSALSLFQKDNEGRTLLARTFTSLPEDAPIKAAMQNLRQVGLLLKEGMGPETPEYKLLPDEKPDTDLNKRIFGRAEPPKTQSQVAISTDRKKQAQLFEGVSKFLDDPATRPAALAILFNLNTGLRPNAVLNLTLDRYYPDTGAVYIEAEVQGAKGRAVNIPLNPVADSILQELLVGKKPGDNFFTKSTGSKVTTADINKILRAVKVPQIMFDQATNTFYDSLHPEDGPGKTGSPLLRNVHSSVALSLGIPQERTAYLQGRSLKAASKGSTGEIAGYQTAFPGDVSDVDREFSSQVSSFYGESAKAAGFDIQTKIPMPESRITTQTPGYENYFDLPAKQEVPQPISAPEDVTNTLSNDATQKLKEDGLYDRIFKKIPGPVKKALGPIGVGLTTVAALQTAEEVEAATGSPVAGAIAGASEFAPVSYSDVKSLAEARAYPDPYSLTPAGRIAAEEQAGFIDLGRNEQPQTLGSDAEPMLPPRIREPEAAPVNQDQGFLSNDGR